MTKQSIIYSKGDYVVMNHDMYNNKLPGDIAKVEFNKNKKGYHRSENAPYIFRFSNSDFAYGTNVCVKYKILVEQDKELIDNFEFERSVSLYNL